MNHPTSLIALHLGVGAAILLFGRRLFWLFLAGTGFVVGALAATRALEGASSEVVLTVAIVAGLLGALLARFAQKVAVLVAGALAGGYLGHAVALGLPQRLHPWAAVAIGAIAGAILLACLFNWALIALSSLTGAAVISQHIPVPPPWPTAAFALLLLVGLAVQAGQLRRKGRKKSSDDD